MLKRFLPTLLLAALALTTGTAQAQALNNATGTGWCGTDALQERYFAEHPGAREAQQRLNKQLEAEAQLIMRSGAALPDVTIPVVVHVIHRGGLDNISDQQVNSAIALLNADYQKLNPDTASTIALFRSIAASIGFQFRLAKKDPNGNCTTGITRHYAPGLVNDDQSGAVQAVSNWDRARYLNIWVVNTIGTSTGGTFTVGYVSPPNDPSNARDGFVVRQDYFGNVGTSSPSRAETRAATHEIGHYFGLIHPWGSGNNPGIAGNCNGTDLVADTPPTNGTFACNLSYAPCGPIANVQNFMDYASCATMFTQGQKARMRSLLNNVRTSLTTTATLLATGTNDGYVAPGCTPVVAFAPTAGSSTSTCVNTPITLRDYSYNATGPLTYSWSFPGGTPASATGQTVTVTYPTAGFYSVTETVTSGAGSSVATVTNYIKVEGPTGGEAAPYAESFENASFPNLFAAPTLRNYETFGVNGIGTAGNYRWLRQAALPAADGSAYLYVFNRFFPAGAITTLLTPNINLSGAPRGAVLTFARAYALRYASSDDQLRVSFSNDCGISWSTPTVFDALALSTQGANPIDGFLPAASTDWANLSVPIPAAFQQSGVFKVRFQFVNGTPSGNNFYFDNLRIGAPLATRANSLASRGISVYPNPLTQETAVHFTLATATQVQVRLTDLLGRAVLTLPARQVAAGAQVLPLLANGRTLPAGVYLVQITLDGEPFSTKLTVE